MKIRKQFLSALSAFILSVFSSSSFAHMEFTYETSVMNFKDEKGYLENGVPFDLYLFSDYEFQFEITFVTPDIVFELENMESVYMEFNNPVVSVVASEFFPNPTVERSSISIEALNYEGFLVKLWLLTFDIADSSLPNDAVLSASIISNGYWDSMTLNLDNFLYERADFQTVMNIEASFEGEYQGEYLDEYPGGLARLFGKHVSVPEPLTPLLFLSGLACILATRKIKENLFIKKTD